MELTMEVNITEMSSNISASVVNMTELVLVPYIQVGWQNFLKFK